MEFSWAAEDLTARRAAADFAARELSPGALESDQTACFPSESWRRCAHFGVQGVILPRIYGGRESSVMTAVAVMEGLGYGCRDNGLLLALNAQIWTVQESIAKFGSDEQKRRYLPAMAEGRLIGAYALTEPNAGSDAYALETRAEKVSGGYVLNGEKCFVTLGPVADVALVFASTNPADKAWGVSAFLVLSTAEGFRAAEAESKMGLRSVPFGRIELRDCFVPDDARLGKEGAGMSISANSLEWERSCMLASQIGAMERQLDETIQYAKQRKQFGKPIGKFQAVANRIAEMKLRLETARLLVYKVAWLKSTGRPVAMEAALAKWHLSQCFTESSLDAIQINGGRGYLTEPGVERDLRDAVGGLLWGGAVDIQKNVVARLLGL